MSLALLVSLMSGAAAAEIRSVTLEWDANADGLTAGYSVAVRTPGAPILSVDVGLSTRAVLPLLMGGRYFVAVHAYEPNGTLGPASVEAEIDLISAPGPPSRLTASVTGSMADVSWAPPTSGAATLSYQLSVGSSPGASNLLNGLIVGPATNVNGALPPGTYYARVRARNLVGVGPASEDVAFQVGDGASAPGSPTGLSVAWSGASAHLSWTAPAGAVPTHYVIDAGSMPGATDIGSFNVGNTTSHVAAGLPDGVYYVRVRAVNVRGSSAASNEASLQRSAITPPGRVGVLEAEVRGDAVVLDWEVPATGGPVQGYVLEAGSSPGLSDIASVAVGDVRVFTTALPPGVYYVRIRAVNDGGLGAPSPEAVVRR